MANEKGPDATIATPAQVEAGRPQEQNDAIEQDSTNVTSPTSPQTDEKAHWLKDEIQTIPHNNLWIVFPASYTITILASRAIANTGVTIVFLAALDQTIIGTALPTIVRNLGSSSGYSWIGSAYLLAASALAPLWGILSVSSDPYGPFSFPSHVTHVVSTRDVVPLRQDLIGRKPVLYFGMIVFMGGSALCGAAKSIVWLILARAIQGIGGGCIIQMSQIVIADIVSLADRGKYAGTMGATWGIASVIGPLLGGLLTDKVSWRWCFYINLPTGGLAAFLLLRLHLNPVPRQSLRTHIANFDFIGLFLIIGAVVCLLVGFNQSETSWKSASTIALITVSVPIFAAGVVNEFYTKRRPIIPPRVFKTRTTFLFLITVFLHAFAFFAATYYLPLYFQSRGATALMSGVRMIPYSLVASAFAIISGQVVARTASYRPIMWIAWGILTLGFGLMIDLDGSSSTAKQVLYLIIAAVGTGCLFQTPMIGMQAAMPVRDMATATSVLGLMRQLGGTVGISAGGAVYVSFLRRRLDKISGYNADQIPNSDLINNVGKLKSLQPQELHDQVVAAYAKSISSI
ncbi:hypothetical protein FRB99_006526, partial [Tulasnella sp. 403]